MSGSQPRSLSTYAKDYLHAADGGSLLIQESESLSEHSSATRRSLYNAKHKSLLLADIAEAAGEEATPEGLRASNSGRHSLKSSNKAIMDEIADRQDEIRFSEQPKGIRALAALASFPPYETPYFNEDGHNYYRSKTMICVFAPSVLAILLILLMCMFPLTNDEIMISNVYESKLDYGFEMIDNSTNQEYLPYSRWYAYLYHLVNSNHYKTSLVHTATFFDNMQVFVFDEKNHTLKDVPVVYIRLKFYQEQEPRMAPLPVSPEGQIDLTHAQELLHLNATIPIFEYMDFLIKFVFNPEQYLSITTQVNKPMLVLLNHDPEHPKADPSQGEYELQWYSTIPESYSQLVSLDGFNMFDITFNELKIIDKTHFGEQQMNYRQYFVDKYQQD